jgi:hypothetical protein
MQYQSYLQHYFVGDILTKEMSVIMDTLIATILDIYWL